jgi:predicted ATPase/DNA-binding SARP family transcriptional activator
MERLEIELLGPPRISLNGEPIRTDRHKAIALLAYLVTEARSTRRDELAALLWPDYPQSSALAYLRRTLWELNKVLGKGWIQADREQVSLVDKPEIWVDIKIFQAALNKDSDQLDALSKAVNLYRGDFLAGLVVADTPSFEEWQSQQAEQYRREFGHMLARVVEEHEQNQDYEQALVFARRWLELDRLDELAYRAVMRQLAGMGDRSGVIHIYQDCVQTLQNELHVPPQPETEATYQAILRGEKLEKRPAKGDGHPAPSTPKPGGNLPTLTPFIGRADELEQVVKLALDPGIHLLNLIGPGGNGKTRLAIQAARQMASAFPDGTWFIPLAAVESVQGIILAIAKGLNFSFYKGDESPQEQLLNYLRDKKLLMLLDNYEHLIEAGKGLVVAIVEMAENVKLIMTSRERLNLQSEQVYRVSGMHVPEGRAILDGDKAVEQAQRFSAIQLWLERARRVKPEFQLTQTNLNPMLEICRLVEGSPLGIELSVNWLELMSPEEIAREINNSLDFLESSAADIPDRQRSLRVVFETSWNRLEAGEQEAFRRLCVFRGSFSRQAAIEVAGTALRTLLSLANKSWLEQADSGRYQLHEVLRQYGLERLKADLHEYQETKNRQAQFYANFTQAQGQALRNAGQIQALQAMKAELESNIPIAWEWLVSAGRCDVIVEKMLPGLFHYWRMNINAYDFIKVLKEARKALSAPTCPEHRLHQAILETAEISLELGWSIYDDHPKERLEELWVRVKESNLADDMGFWYIVLATTYGSDINYAEVSRQIGEVMQKVNIFQDPWELGYCYLVVSMFSWTSQRDNRKKYLLQALKTFQQAGVVDEQGVTLRELADVVASEGDYKLAIEYNQKALDLFDQAGDLLGIDIIWSRQASYNIVLGNIDQAFHAFKVARNLHEKSGSRRKLGNILAEESRAASRYGDLDYALTTSLKSLEIAHEVGNQNDIAWHTWEAGEVYRLLGNLEEARKYYLGALPAFEKMQELIGLGFYHRGMGDLAMMKGDLEEARAEYERALVFHDKEQRVYRTWGLVVVHARLGNMLTQRGAFDKARQHLRTSLAMAKGWHNPDIKALPLTGLASLLITTGLPARALKIAACVASKPTTWNEVKKQAWVIAERARRTLPTDEAGQCEKRGEGMEIEGMLRECLEELGKSGS